MDLKIEFSDDCMENIRDVSDSLDDDSQHGHFYKFFDCLVDTEENPDEGCSRVSEAVQTTNFIMFPSAYVMGSTHNMETI